MSDSEIRSWLPRASVLVYSGFAAQVKAGVPLRTIMGPSQTLVLLYETRPRQGHWVVVFERPTGAVECFDSLGYLPDNELEFVPRSYRGVSDQDHSWLLWALAQDGRSVEYNEVPLQRDVPGVATCGRWCVLRVACRDASVAQFQRAFKGLDGDGLVAELVS